MLLCTLENKLDRKVLTLRGGDSKGGKIVKKVRITLKYAEEIYNLTMKMYRKEDKKGINISVIKKNGEYRVVHMREKSIRAYLIMDYPELKRLVYANLDRQIRKRKAIQTLHRKVNYRVDQLLKANQYIYTDSLF